MFDPDGPVLGVDPGLSRCGYGAVRRTVRGHEAVAYGVLRTLPADPLAGRLAQLHCDLDALVAEVRPSAVAVERILFQANARTAIAVGQASGLVLAVAAGHGVEVHHYSPNEVKQSVTGDGAADKVQVQTMVTRLLGLGAPPRPADAADALALALCHVWRAPLAAAGAAAGRQAGFERAVAAALARDVTGGAR